MIKISVIVPVYNAEEYIERSLLSLINQTLDDIEIIIIDDGSTDNSLSIINKIIKQHLAINKKINLISRGNKGVAATRAEGVRLANGEYIIHLDSDDWAEHDWLQLMYEIANKQSADIVICDYTEVYSNKKCHISQKCTSLKKENIESLLTGKLSNSNWDKLIKKSIITKNNINFIENINMGEDFLFTLQVLFHSKKICHIPKPLYNYNKTNQNSLTYIYSEKSLLDIINVIQIAEDFLTKKDYLIQVKESFNLFKLNIRVLHVMSPNYNNIKKAITLYPETNYLINTSKSPKILRIIFILTKFKMFFLNKLILKLYRAYRNNINT